MIEKQHGPLVSMDLTIAESQSPQEAKDEFNFYINQLEIIARSVLAEQNVQINTVSIQLTDYDSRDFSERAITAIHAYISIRLLKIWSAEAEKMGSLTAKRLHLVASQAVVAATATSLVGPVVTRYRFNEQQASKARAKGAQATKLAAEERARRIRDAVASIWADGKRYRSLDQWTNAVCALDPTLTPPDRASNVTTNRIVSRQGKILFGSKWPKL